jgi:hypothetical protein
MAMNERGGTLNYTDVEILRTLDRECWVATGLFNKKRCKYILPSTSDLRHETKRVERFADEIVLVTICLNPSGEGCVFFDVHAVVRLLIEVYGLSEAATHGPI